MIAKQKTQYVKFSFKQIIHSLDGQGEYLEDFSEVLNQFSIGAVCGMRMSRERIGQLSLYWWICGSE